MKNKYLANYLIAVEHPGVSGFEVLELLLVRSKLALQETSLDGKQKMCLYKADQRLIEQASAFYAELEQITDLTYERLHRRTSPEQWWWYLDVLASLPLIPQQSHQPEMVPV